MPLLIDGHNLIGKMHDLSLAEPNDEADLVQRIRSYCQRARRRATIVFDAGLIGGDSHALSSSQVKVVFASSASSADAVILQRLRKAGDPAGILVISSDQKIQSAARARGARVVPAEEFAAELIQPSPDGRPPEKPEPPGEISEWLEIFGD